MAITQITDHEAAALARLLQQYKGKTNFQNLLKQFTTEFQAAEDAIYDLLSVLSIDTVEGEVLDLIGVVVGIARESGQTDAVYRQFLKAKIGQNFSDGTMPEVYEIFNILRGAADGWIIELFPAEIRVTVSSAIDADVEPYIEPILQDSVGASILVNGVKYYEPNPFILGWTGQPDPTTLGKGLSWTGSLDQGRIGWTI